MAVSVTPHVREQWSTDCRDELSEEAVDRVWREVLVHDVLEQLAMRAVLGDEKAARPDDQPV